MNIITLSDESIDKEHICCAMGNQDNLLGINAKKTWLKARFNDGLKFKKFDVRGKVFIEYLPAQMAWVPVTAEGYMLINCHWVSGKFKGQGYGAALLAECEKEAQDLGMKGVVVISSHKKKPFLSEKNFYLALGYTVVDKAPPYFQLLAKSFTSNNSEPKFSASAQKGLPEGTQGIDIFYTAQCPFCLPYIEILKPVISTTHLPVRLHHITTREEAQQHYCPITTYSVFINGHFYTQEILTAKKLLQLLSTIS